MAYVQPGPAAQEVLAAVRNGTRLLGRLRPHASSEDVLAAVLRNGARVVAVAAYGIATTVAVVLLAPVLFHGNSGAAVNVPEGPKTVTLRVKPGQPAATIAGAQGVSVSRLYSLNPALTPLGVPARQRILVELR